MKLKKPQTIGIIGGLGQMGSKFHKIFLHHGYDVLIADIGTKVTNGEVASQCDVVIVSVPIHSTEKVLREVAPKMKKGAMLTDFTSVKILPAAVVEENIAPGAFYMGGHPLFAPSTDWSKQHFIICGNCENIYTRWYVDFLQKLGLEVISMTAEEHDRHMAVIQCLTHFSNLSLGSALEKLQYDLDRGEKIATAIYQMRLYGVGRILAQDPMLYADIQRFNPYAKKVSSVYLEAVKELNQSVANENEDAFADIFKKSKKYFGSLTEKSLKITNYLIKKMNQYE